MKLEERAQKDVKSLRGSIKSKVGQVFWGEDHLLELTRILDAYEALEKKHAELEHWAATHIVSGMVKQFEMHEVDEFLRFDGAYVKHPHPEYEKVKDGGA